MIGQGRRRHAHAGDQALQPDCATTRAGLLSAPLRSRFGIVLRLEFYTTDDLRINRAAFRGNSSVSIDEGGASEIADGRGVRRASPTVAARVRGLRAGGRQDAGRSHIDRATGKHRWRCWSDKHGFRRN